MSSSGSSISGARELSWMLLRPGSIGGGAGSFRGSSKLFEVSRGPPRRRRARVHLDGVAAVLRLVERVDYFFADEGCG